MLQAIRVFAVAAIFRATRGLHIRGAPGLGPERAQEGGGVRRTRADLHVVGLQQGAALVAPILLQLKNNLLKSDHELLAGLD
jgi:hypothetical protein